MGGERFCVWVGWCAAVERKHIRAYLKEDGEKKIQIRKVVYGARKHLPTIRSDLEPFSLSLTSLRRQVIDQIHVVSLIQVDVDQFES